MKIGDLVQPKKGVCSGLGGRGPYEVTGMLDARVCLRTPHGLTWVWASKVEKHVKSRRSKKA